MKNSNMGFNPEGVASLNELLETRELTGQMPETMPIGIKAKNRENIGSEYCNCDCNSDPQCDCECDCGGECDTSDCYSDSD